MQPAADVMADALGDADMHDAAVPVYCNVTAGAESAAYKLRENLVTQVTGRVRLCETLNAVSAAGVTCFVEIGTGKVPSGLVKRTLDEATMVNLETADDLDTVLQAMPTA